MRKYLLLVLFFAPCLAFGQGTQITTLSADPATCNTGMLYFNSTSNTQKACGPANTWTAVGVSGLTQVSSLPATCTAASTAPVQLTVSPFGIYICTATNTWTAAVLSSAANTTSISAASFGVVADGGKCNAPSLTVTSGTGSVNLTCTSAAPGNIGNQIHAGQKIFCTNWAGGTSPFDASYPGVGIIVASQAITSVTGSSGNVTVNFTTSNATASSTATAGTCYWGTDNSTAEAAAATAAFTGPVCGFILQPVGFIWTEGGLWNSSNCSGGGTGWLSFYGAVSGMSPGITSTFIIPPSFDYTTCTGTTNGGQSTCFGGVRGFGLYNLSFEGGGSSTNPAAAHAFIGTQIDGTYENLMVLGVCPNCANLIGFQIGPGYHTINNITIDGVSGSGQNTCSVVGNANAHTVNDMFCGNGKGTALNVASGAILGCRGCFFQQSGSSTASTVVDVTGTLYDTNGGVSSVNTGAATNGYIIRSGGKLYLSGSSTCDIRFTNGNYCVNVVSGGAALLQNNTLLAGQIAARHCPSGAICLNGGGNTYAGTVSDTFPTLTSTGTGTTPCVPAIDAGSTNEGGSATCTLTAGTAATGTFVLNFEGTFELPGGTNVPSCVGTLVNGTATMTAPVEVWPNVPTTTAITFNWSAGGTLPTSGTIKIAWSCIPR